MKSSGSKRQRGRQEGGGDETVRRRGLVCAQLTSFYGLAPRACGCPTGTSGGAVSPHRAVSPSWQPPATVCHVRRRLSTDLSRSARPNNVPSVFILLKHGRVKASFLILSLTFEVPVRDGRWTDATGGQSVRTSRHLLEFIHQLSGIILRFKARSLVGRTSH